MCDVSESGRRRGTVAPQRAAMSHATITTATSTDFGHVLSLVLSWNVLCVNIFIIHEGAKRLGGAVTYIHAISTLLHPIGS